MKSLKIKFVLALSILLQIAGLLNAQKIVKSPPVMTAPGNALAFDGTNDMVDLGNSASVQLSQGTIEAWIKTPNAGDSYRGIVVKQWAYALFMCDNELVAYSWDGSNNVSTGVYLNDNKWHHVALSFNAGVANGSSIYIDGVKKRTFTYIINHQGVGLGIGNGSTDTKIQIFNGLIDDARVWNVARSDSQIKSTMYNELAGNEIGLVAYYNFNQGTAGGDNSSISTITDLSTNALHGTLTGFNKTGSSSNFVESYAMVVPVPTAATNIGAYSFTANWSAPLIGTVNSYKLDVSTSANFDSFVSGYNGLDCSTNLTQTINGLSSGITYYYRVRTEKTSVTGSGGSVGESVIVNTLSIPKIITNVVTKLSSTSMSTGGFIASDGGFAITERGICWSTSTNPTTDDNKATNASVADAFYCTVSGLVENTKYYVRAYAINSLGTAYGNEKIFFSGLNIQTGVISISSNLRASSGGFISAPDGTLITERGVCWSTSASPTISNDHSSDGAGIGEFTSSLVRLQHNAKYYVRAYATINQNTYYGDEYSFINKRLQYQANYGEIFTETETNSEPPEFLGSGGGFLFYTGDSWCIDYYSYSYDGGTPPLGGWDYNILLTNINPQKPTITFDKSNLKEAACNDGSIKEIITITHDNLNGATFAGTNNEDFVATGKAIVRNLPAGLTVKIIRNNSLSLTLSITGKATAHANANDISNLKIMFAPDAFTDGNSLVTNGNVTNISLDFIEPVDMTVTGTKTCADYTITADNNLTLDNNSTLTINSVTSANQITLNPGAKLNLSNSVTVGDVILKADDNISFSAKLGSGMTINGTLAFQKTMLDTKWYFLSFPCNVNVADISMVGGGTVGVDFYIQTYSGSNRATNGMGVNWSHITTGTLEAKKGYAFGLKTGVGTKTLSFVLDKTIAECETAATVPTTFFDGSIGNNHKGWNLIGQPYLSKFAGSDVGINYITTWNGSAYVGRTNNLVGSLNPFEAFFVQVAATSPISFSLDGRQSARSVVNQNIQESIQLNVANTGGSDFSTLIFDNEHSSDYEIGYDLEKWITTGAEKPQIYSQLNGIKYAYNALPISNAINLPIGFYTKTGGSTTISANNATVAGLSKLLLFDNQTNATTDLLTESYSFDADAGTNNSRFSIIPQRISTNVPEKLAGDKPYVFVSNSKLTISNLTANTTIRLYDATGKVLHVATTNGNNNYEIALKSAGMYVVQIDSNTGSCNYKLAAN